MQLGSHPCFVLWKICYHMNIQSAYRFLEDTAESRTSVVYVPKMVSLIQTFQLSEHLQFVRICDYKQDS